MHNQIQTIDLQFNRLTARQQYPDHKLFLQQSELCYQDEK